MEASKIDMSWGNEGLARTPNPGALLPAARRAAVEPMLAEPANALLNAPAIDLYVHTYVHLAANKDVFMLSFEWNADKAASNYAKHHIRFDQAIAVFSDPNAIESHDDREHYGEDRFLIIGFVDPEILAVVYTERDGDTYRIISARKATSNERKIYENRRH